MTVIVARFTLRILGPDVSLDIRPNNAEKKIEEQVKKLDLEAIEDAINDKLPEDWYSKIME